MFSSSMTLHNACTSAVLNCHCQVLNYMNPDRLNLILPNTRACLPRLVYRLIVMHGGCNNLTGLHGNAWDMSQCLCYMQWMLQPTCPPAAADALCSPLCFTSSSCCWAELLLVACGNSCLHDCPLLCQMVQQKQTHQKQPCHEQHPEQQLPNCCMHCKVPAHHAGLHSQTVVRVSMSALCCRCKAVHKHACVLAPITAARHTLLTATCTQVALRQPGVLPGVLPSVLSGSSASVAGRCTPITGTNPATMPVAAESE
ncbi:hypothetical protein COO60DRAFT_72800 [Scenedesmus sp. NREL 46B-D3]|nr:hypothetical protein COO60DRAFT_72800 [Scenedesmus sp. NREL 46B-D3]